jgi:hypothetical protein
MMMTAHHEAGHLATAAALELRLRPEGIMVDTEAAGLACYCKEPEDSDLSRERVIISTFAGCCAQDRYCEGMSYSPVDYFAKIWSPDWREARGVLVRLSYFGSKGADELLADLERRSKMLVDQNWDAIVALAHALLAKDWEPLKPLGSGGQWSNAAAAKYLSGEDAVWILAQHGIVTERAADC